MPPHRKIKLVIFDLDGTLIDSLTDLALATNHALRLNGFPEHPVDKYKQFVGNGLGKLIERALPEKRRNPSVQEQVKADFLKYYSAHLNDHTRPYPGITELLDELEKRRIAVAVATNKPEPAARAIVAEIFKGFPFSVILGQTPGRPVKPDPAIVYEIMKTVGVRSAEALYVGDSGVDMQTAHHAAITAIGCLWGFRDAVELKSSGASHLVSEPSGILQFCK